MPRGQNLVWTPKNCDREDEIEHNRSCPMLQRGVKGENEIWNEYAVWV